MKAARHNGGMSDVPQTFYDAVGGAETFRTIVSRFYEQVREDEVLLPLYPVHELDAAEDRLRMFLEQYWGGPRTYSDLRRFAGLPAELAAAFVHHHLDGMTYDEIGEQLGCSRRKVGYLLQKAEALLREPGERTA